MRLVYIYVLIVAGAHPLCEEEYNNASFTTINALISLSASEEIKRGWDVHSLKGINQTLSEIQNHINRNILVKNVSPSSHSTTTSIQPDSPRFLIVVSLRTQKQCLTEKTIIEVNPVSYDICGRVWVGKILLCTVSSWNLHVHLWRSVFGLLGLSQLSFTQYRNKNGDLMSTLFVSESRQLMTRKATESVNGSFNLYLYEKGQGYGDPLWAEDVLANESVMSAGFRSDRPLRLSKVDWALLEDSGWYRTINQSSSVMSQVVTTSKPITKKERVEFLEITSVMMAFVILTISLLVCYLAFSSIKSILTSERQ